VDRILSTFIIHGDKEEVEKVAENIRKYYCDSRDIQYSVISVEEKASQDFVSMQKAMGISNPNQI